MHEAAQQMLVAREAYRKDLADYAAQVNQFTHAGKQ